MKDEGQDSKSIPAVCQTSVRDKEVKNPSKEELSPRTANKAAGHRGGRQKPPSSAATISVDSGPSRRTACKKQPRRTERTSGGDNLNSHSIDDLNFDHILLENNSLCEQPKPRPCNSKEHRKDTQCISACEKRRTRGAGKTAPKSKEFIETESSSSTSSDTDLQSEHEEYPFHKSQTVASASTGGDQKQKDSGGHNASKGNDRGTFGSVNTRTSHDIAKDLEEQFYTLVPFGRNELLSPLKDTDEIRALWVKIDLTLLSRIPQRSPEEPPLMNAGLKEAVSMQHNIVPDVPAEKVVPKARRKRKVGLLDMFPNLRGGIVCGSPICGHLLLYFVHGRLFDVVVRIPLVQSKHTRGCILAMGKEESLSGPGLQSEQTLKLSRCSQVANG